MGDAPSDWIAQAVLIARAVSVWMGVALNHPVWMELSAETRATWIAVGSTATLAWKVKPVLMDWTALARSVALGFALQPHVTILQEMATRRT